MRPHIVRVFTAAAASGLVLALTPSVVDTAAAEPVPDAVDYCEGQCDYILPPGQAGNATIKELLAFLQTGKRPAHFSDQLGKYEDLVRGYSGLTDDQLDRFFNDESFGVPDDEVASTIHPRDDVTIVRDKRDGVPHITGETRAGTMFGAGYAGAADRLFVMDVFRHLGRGNLTSLAGGAVGNREFEQQIWRIAPYTNAELRQQFDDLADLGEVGVRMQQDARSWVKGVNAYIAEARKGAELPGEYVALGHPTGPTKWKVTDILATAAVAGGMFGSGGGSEMQSALALIEARARYGKTRGIEVWKAFRAAEDPETVTTVDESFPYGTDALTEGTVLPDRGSVRAANWVTDRKGSAKDSRRTPRPTGRSLKGFANDGVLPDGFLDEPTTMMSNATMVSGEHTESGNPVAVFGPQTGFFAPQLWMVQELQGPGVSAAGASFAGLNFAVLVGRGQDYAWSPTSAMQDITDSYAVRLCNLKTGARGTLTSRGYRFHGDCLPIRRVKRHSSWKPSLGDQTPKGSYTLVADRTKLGIITHRANVYGRATAFTSLRSTFMHEGDAAAAFLAMNDPEQVSSAEDFQRAASRVNYTFNWFYVDDQDIAYFNSGANPIRPDGADANLPTEGRKRYEWKGWHADDNSADYTSFEEHPQAVDKDYLVNWNNKQAPGYNAADGNFMFGSVHRAQLLDDRVRAQIDSGEKFTRASLVSLVEEAGLEDPRADRPLGLLLDVIGDRPIKDQELATAVQKLRVWRESGGLRTAGTSEKPKFKHSRALRVLDAWWPRVVRAEFRPKLHKGLYASLLGAAPILSGYSHRGNASADAWSSWMSKDLRRILGRSVDAPLPRLYCGEGTVATCRKVLLKSLDAALDVPKKQVYPADGTCKAADQYCAAQTLHQSLGGITQDPIHWQNRSTFQQVIEFPGGR
ncbi:penicillin acylase family protein [Solicola gregarius]|uniref:Penicillin acylase family protein n=1 Tax=Solicola gregarius TaxID=2908642 RepID=A0AA46TKR9_9ACTN|nr:penicillin acylase family protein [Solicola gregarius]UYM07117.1 penicillin acylase family protein [Solicola gregarius]